jgi:hypothetical protein
VGDNRYVVLGVVVRGGKDLREGKVFDVLRDSAQW